MRYALYPGCTVLGRARNYEMAAREVAKVLGIEFIELDAFECCGYPVKSVDHDTFLHMAARNILIAEQHGLNICTLCSACTSSLTEVNRYLASHFTEKARVVARLRKNGIYCRTGTSIAVKHFARVLYEDIGCDEIERKIRNKLDLSVAAHYGCHYLKPSEIYGNFEDPENPHSLDRLINITGARAVDYSEKLRCCGAGVIAVSEDLAYALSQPKLHELSQLGADAMALICPFCSVMYDDNQRKIEKKYGQQYSLPILYYPQLLGLAMGIDTRLLGLRMNRVSTKKLLEPQLHNQGDKKS